MSSRGESRRCLPRLGRMWTNLKTRCSAIFSHYSRQRRRTSRSSEHIVTLVNVTRTTPPPHGSTANWINGIDPLCSTTNNRAPPRKRYHDHSPSTLLQIKIALQEQVIKDSLTDELQKDIIKTDTEMESGEKMLKNGLLE